jgi:hypothetical protein
VCRVKNVKPRGKKGERSSSERAGAGDACIDYGGNGGIASAGELGAVGILNEESDKGIRARVVERLDGAKERRFERALI